MVLLNKIGFLIVNEHLRFLLVVGCAFLIIYHSYFCTIYIVIIYLIYISLGIVLLIRMEQ